MLADHFMIPFAPLLALQAVADATTTLRLGQTVLNQCEKLVQTRDRLGISYFSAPLGSSPELLAPVIARLAPRAAKAARESTRGYWQR